MQNGTVPEEFARSALLWGRDAIAKLMDAHVAVFGVGGVGGACCEALIRGGIGSLTMFDPDTVSVSNINRQLPALHSTVGQYKAEALRARLLDINPGAEINVQTVFYSAENAQDHPLGAYDYVVDCIDTVTSKVLLISLCREKNVPIISAMGAGNKQDPTRFRVMDLAETSVCPLARAMRQQLRKKGIEHHKVVFSDEPPMETAEAITENGRHIPGSLSFVPPVLGYILAGEVLKALAGKAGE